MYEIMTVEKVVTGVQQIVNILHTHVINQFLLIKDNQCSVLCLKKSREYFDICLFHEWLTTYASEVWEGSRFFRRSLDCVIWRGESEEQNVYDCYTYINRLAKIRVAQDSALLEWAFFSLIISTQSGKKR